LTIPTASWKKLTAIYENKGLTRRTAELVAAELTAHNAFAAHAEAELKIDPDDVARPMEAAVASTVSFTLGAVLPLVAILLPPASARVLITIAAVLVALGIARAISARLGHSRVATAVLRVVAGGAAGLALTYLFGHSIS
jgi:VIT1/CCC1 family predicted Fe2+/Mn2+ transporter